MAFTSAGAAGTGMSVASGTTLLLTASRTIAAGEFVFIIVGSDETTTEAADGNSTLHTSISMGGAGNPAATKLREFVNAQVAGTAADGAVVSIWGVVLAAGITSGATLATVNFASAITAKAATAWGFTSGLVGGDSFSVVANATDLANDAAAAGSMAISGLASASRLYLRGIAQETRSITFTPSTSFTTVTSLVADSGTAATSMRAVGEFRINTSTGETSAPTNVAADSASIFLAIVDAVSANLMGQACL